MLWPIFTEIVGKENGNETPSFHKVQAGYLLFRPVQLVQDDAYRSEPGRCQSHFQRCKSGKFSRFELKLFPVTLILGCFQIDEAKAEVKQIVEYLKDPERFCRLGARLPKGNPAFISS